METHTSVKHEKHDVPFPFDASQSNMTTKSRAQSRQRGKCVGSFWALVPTTNRRNTTLASVPKTPTEGCCKVVARSIIKTLGECETLSDPFVTTLAHDLPERNRRSERCHVELSTSLNRKRSPLLVVQHWRPDLESTLESGFVVSCFTFPTCLNVRSARMHSHCTLDFKGRIQLSSA